MTRADRRIERTKTALRDGLLQLMREKKYERISTQDIVTRANVGRSTFYAHYADKDDLLQENLDALADHLRYRMSHSENETVFAPLSFSLPMLEHMVAVKGMFIQLLGPNGSKTVQQMFHDTLCILVSESLDTHSLPPRIPKPVIVEFTAAGFMAMARWWVTESPDMSTQKVNQMVVELISPIFTGEQRQER